QPVADWNAAAAAVRENMGLAFPDRHDDDAFWMAMARRTHHQLDDGRVELDYDPHIALAFADIDFDAPPPDMTPLFQALAQKPMLSVRGSISDICPASVAEKMRALKPDLDEALIENVGHAPMLDEPAAWDAILDFLARVD